MHRSPNSAGRLCRQVQIPEAQHPIPTFADGGGLTGLRLGHGVLVPLLSEGSFVCR